MPHIHPKSPFFMILFGLFLVFFMGCEYQIPIVNGDFEVPSTPPVGWTAEQGTGMSSVSCLENTASLKVFGCTGNWGLYPMGNEGRGVLSQTISIDDISANIDTGEGTIRITTQLAAAVVWDASSPTPSCNVDNANIHSDSIQLKAIFLNASNTSLGEVATDVYECIGRADAFRPNSGRVTFVIYKNLEELTGDSVLSGAIPSGTRKVKFQFIGVRVGSTGVIDSGADTLAATIQF